ncbi:MAG: histidinol dehydrogenase [Oscillospiraceae bacterium]|nr:histidinol dehydrogenase [Ruminococcus sp.]MCD8345199.1 histidinol dehydrogenase [Oscillospiraceae bacterium]
MIKIYNYSEENSEIFRKPVDSQSVAETVSEIIANVKANGDKALKEYSLKFDKTEIEDFRVTESEIEAAYASVEPEFVRILNEAAENIRDFHKHQLRSSFVVSEKDGIVCGQKIIPFAKVGLYVPGGTAAYPSTVLMDAVPAKLAGCGEIVMVTPPSKDGGINKYILAAAKIAGIDRIYKVGGAQAVAALAYGTESIPRVDKIVGPGNAFVAEAKRQVYGEVAIDMIAGPSDILVVADEKSNPRFVAADLLSQAEHDRMASAVLVTDSEELAVNVQAEIEEQLAKLPREEIARASIETNGKIIVTRDISEAIEVANIVAPEHIELCLDNPFDVFDKVKNAGSIFMGRYCPEALGDYLSGANHTLPTNGSARFSSPLSVDDFVKKSQFTYYTKEAFEKVYGDVAYFAEKEGLEAHAKSALIRFQEI